MPIYEYVCPVCHIKFESRRTMNHRDNPTACPEGHEGCFRVMSIAAAFSKDEFGDITTAGRVDTGMALPGGFDCSQAWSADPVEGWDYSVDSESGRVMIPDESSDATHLPID